MFDEVGDTFVGVVAAGCTHLAGKADRQHPGRLVLAGQEWAQLRRGEEVLNHRDVGDVILECFDDLAVLGFVGLLESGIVDEGGDQEII